MLLSSQGILAINIYTRYGLVGNFKVYMLSALGGYTSLIL